MGVVLVASTGNFLLEFEANGLNSFHGEAGEAGLLLQQCKIRRQCLATKHHVFRTLVVGVRVSKPYPSEYMLHLSAEGARLGRPHDSVKTASPFQNSARVKTAISISHCGMRARLQPDE